MSEHRNAPIENAIRELREEIARSFASVNHRLDHIERNYHEAVGVLPLMHELREQQDVILRHLEDGGERAKLMRKVRHHANGG